MNYSSAFTFIRLYTLNIFNIELLTLAIFGDISAEDFSQLVNVELVKAITRFDNER